MRLNKITRPELDSADPGWPFSRASSAGQAFSRLPETLPRPAVHPRNFAGRAWRALGMACAEAALGLMSPGRRGIAGPDSPGPRGRSAHSLSQDAAFLSVRARASNDGAGRFRLRMNIDRRGICIRESGGARGTRSAQGRGNCRRRRAGKTPGPGNGRVGRSAGFSERPLITKWAADSCDLD